MSKAASLISRFLSAICVLLVAYGYLLMWYGLMPEFPQ